MELFERFEDIVKVYSILNQFPKEVFLSCIAMSFDEYTKANGGDPVKMAKAIAEVVESVNKELGAY